MFGIVKKSLSVVREKHCARSARKQKTVNPREKHLEGWEDGTPPPHRDFKERSVVR